MRRYLLAAVFAAALPGAAQAGALEDAAGGLAAQRQKHYTEAILLYTRALEEGGLSGSDQATIHYNRGLAYLEEEQYDKAIADDGEAIRLKPDMIDAYRDRGTAYFRDGQYEKAIADDDVVIREKPSAEAYDNRGNAYRLLRRFDKAVADLSEAIRRDPSLTTAYDGRGNALTHQQHWEQAIADYDKAIALDPENGDFFSDRGYARFYLARYGAAAEDFQKSLSIDPERPYAALWLHLAAAKLGRDDRQDFSDNVALQDSDEWPAPVLRLFTGGASPDELLAAAGSGDAASQQQQQQRCEAAFYLGEYALLQHKTGEAKTHFNEARATCANDSVEYEGALSELKRLGM